MPLYYFVSGPNQHGKESRGRGGKENWREEERGGSEGRRRRGGHGGLG